MLVSPVVSSGLFEFLLLLKVGFLGGEFEQFATFLSCYVLEDHKVQHPLLRVGVGTLRITKVWFFFFFESHCPVYCCPWKLC